MANDLIHIIEHESQPIEHVGSIRFALDRAEAILGLSLAGFITLCCTAIPFLLVASNHPNWSGLNWAFAGVACNAAIVLEFLSVAYLWRRLWYTSYPYAVGAALGQPDYPAVLKPLAFLWWIANAAAYLWVAERVTSVWISFQGENGIPNLDYGSHFVLYFIFSFLANLYILLAVGAAWRSEHVIRRVWRWRLVLDLIIATGMMWL